MNTMEDTNPVKKASHEAVLLRAALEAFRDATGIQMVIDMLKAANNMGQEPDALVRLVAPGVERQFAVGVKSQLSQATLGVAVHQLERFSQKGLIVTSYVNPKMAERLKALNTPFLDVSGNAYLNEPPIYVFIKGNKSVENPHRKPLPRAFQPTGLKVLFELLSSPGLENAPYRDIAKAASVALGTVGWVVADLKDLGYLVDMGRHGRRLTQKAKLIERWAITYPELLRPKLVLGRYTAVDREWWKHTQIRDFQAYWGGEVAAAKLTKYLKPELLTIYTREKLGHLLFTNMLKQDPNGEIEILSAFWQNENEWSNADLVPPLLIYADLLATGDSRNIETARMVYERELAGLVRED